MKLDRITISPKARVRYTNFIGTVFLKISTDWIDWDDLYRGVFQDIDYDKIILKGKDEITFATEEDKEDIKSIYLPYVSKQILDDVVANYENIIVDLKAEQEIELAKLRLKLKKLEDILPP